MQSIIINLKIGITKYEPGWEIIFNQLGVSWDVISSYSQNLSSNYSVIILNSLLTTDQKKYIEHFLSDGGNILSVYGFGSQVISLPTRKIYFSSVDHIKQTYCNTNTILDIFAHGIVIGNNQTISHHPVFNGVLINIPFDVNSMMLTNTRMRKNFYYHKERLPNEIVSTVSKGELRQLITSSLEYLHHQRGVPFIHQWYFPNDQKTIFTFRIDSDKGNNQEIEELFLLSDRYNIPTTWFLDIKSHKDWLMYFSKFLKQEIGIHCYEHKTYHSEKENYYNFHKAIQLIEPYSQNTVGGAAPYGKWNKSITASFEKLGFEYSSEFSFDYDNLPSNPWLGERFSTVLQLPVHPICPGSMRRAGYSAKDQIHYYLNLINRNISLREPICFYHHPTHHFNPVVEAIFKYINEQNIVKYSYRDYAAMWKKRLKNKREFYFNTQTQSIQSTTEMKIDDFWYRISIDSDSDMIHSLEYEMQLSKSLFSQQKKSVQIPNDLVRARSFDWRHYLINALEYYSKLRQ